MRHAKHSKPVRVAQIALALIVALVASSAAAQQRAPAVAGPSYGPVLHPRATKSEPGAQPEQTPQAQEEKAGMPPQDARQDVDPSARPAPQAADAARSGTKKPPKKQAARTPRRSVEARIATVPQVLPSRPLPMAAPAPAQPLPVNAGPVQINSCLGGTCTDTAGGTYQTGVGNAAVNSAGRLCTRSGNTVQCF